MTEEPSAPAESTTPPKPAARKAAARPVARENAGPPPFGGALIASLSRLDRPGIGDPYQSGHRLWPD